MGSIGVGIAVAGVAAVVNLVVSSYLERTGRATGSNALHANAADLRTDAIVSVAVVVSLVLVKLTGVTWMDPVVGLLVAAAITRTGVRILVDASRRLVDETLPADELAALQQVVQSFVGDEVVGYHDLRTRHVGSRHQVDLHLQFASGTSLERAHYVSAPAPGRDRREPARNHRARAPRARGPRAARPLRAARQRVLVRA